jgi:hypothetical protein
VDSTGDQPARRVELAGSMVAAVADLTAAVEAMVAADTGD